MFVSDRIIYPQMQKTGCTHITRVLHEIVGGRVNKKHEKFTEPKNGRVVLGSVRNPWDWYVSLWAFGCAMRGGVYLWLTRDKRTKSQRIVSKILRKFRNYPNALASIGINLQLQPKFKRWRNLYRDPTDVHLFRAWLERVFSDEGKLELGEGYPESGLHLFAGFMTYRFVSLYSDYEPWINTSAKLKTMSDLESFWQRHCTIDRIIRQESLEQDLIQALKEFEFNVESSYIMNLEKTNTSRHYDWRYYYNDRTARLVRDQDDFIIRMYDYKGPFEPT